MAIISHADDEHSFETDVLAADRPVVVDFWAPWCRPCRLVESELDRLADDYGDRARFVKVNIDANPVVADRYVIRSIPTIALFEHGRLVATSVGAKPRHVIETDLDLRTAAPADAATSERYQ